MFKISLQQKNIALFLCYQLSQDPKTISFEDAQKLAELILPVPIGMDKEIYIKNKIWETLEESLAQEMGDSLDENENFLIEKLDEISNDPYEETRWCILAGCMDCLDPEKLEAFTKRMGMDSVEHARPITVQLWEIAHNQRIEFPLPVMITPEEAPPVDKRFEEVSSLSDITEILFIDKPVLTLIDARRIIGNFIDLTSEKEICAGIKLGLRSYDQDMARDTEKLETEDGYEVRLDNVSEKIMMVDETEATRWMLLSVIINCYADDALFDRLLNLMDVEPAEIYNLIEIIENIALSSNIIDFDEGEPLMQIDQFIDNHTIKNPKQNPDDKGPSSDPRFSP